MRVDNPNAMYARLLQQAIGDPEGGDAEPWRFLTTGGGATPADGDGSPGLISQLRETFKG